MQIHILAVVVVMMTTGDNNFVLFGARTEFRRAASILEAARSASAAECVACGAK